MATDLIKQGDWLKITRPPKSEGGDGSVIYVRIEGTNIGMSTNPSNTVSTTQSDTIDLDVFNNLIQKNTLNWHNCYSFGNGVESNRVGDTFNSMKITPGVKVSTIYEDYKKELKAKNSLDIINDMESFLLNAINSTNEGYVSEGGHVERWVGGIDKEKMTKEVIEGAKVRRESILKNLNATKKTTRTD